MLHVIRRLFSALILFGFTVTLAGCGGGSKILKQPIDVDLEHPLATAADERLEVTLDWVIVKDGPGTWSKNAWWDEYQLRVRNYSADPVMISSIQVIDSLGTALANGANRKELVRGSKVTRKRYKDHDINVKPGAGTGTLLAVGTGALFVGSAAAMVSVGAGLSSAFSLGATTASTPVIVSAAGAAAAIAFPVFIVGGVVKGANNSAVNKEIISRQVELPIELNAGEEQALNVFFPVAPSPRSVQLVYETDDKSGVVEIPTADILAGLHLDKSAAEETAVAAASGDE